MSSDILTCRCRHCGKTFPYLRSAAGAQAECPDCHGSVLLPGQLQGVASKRKSRINSVPTLSLEIGGFLLLFWYPIGTIAGVVMIFIGHKNASILRCSNCDEPTSAVSTKCANCRCAFSSE